MLNILYEDNDVIVCIKPVGTSSQSDKSFDPDMVSLLKNHLASKGIDNPYIAVVHRLDKPVGGIMVYAKKRHSAAVLSESLKTGGFNKHYYAVVCSQDVPSDATYTDFLVHDVKKNITSVVGPHEGGLESSQKVIIMETLCTKDISYLTNYVNDSPFPYAYISLADILLYTGRVHQIRTICAHHNIPLFGDMKYNPVKFQRTSVALFAYSLSFIHPVTKKEMTFSAIPNLSIFKSFNLPSGTKL